MRHGRDPVGLVNCPVEGGVCRRLLVPLPWCCGVLWRLRKDGHRKAPADDMGGTGVRPDRNAHLRLDAIAASPVGRGAAPGPLSASGGCESIAAGAAASRLDGPVQLSGRLREERAQTPETKLANPR